MIKAYTIPPVFRFNKIAGQVPSKGRMRTLGQVQALSKKGARSGEAAANLTLGNLSGKPQKLTIPGDPFPMPGDMTEDRLLAQDQPVLSASNVVAGLGLDADTVAEWKKFLDKNRTDVDNEVVFRKTVVVKLQESGFESPVRNVILSRALSYWRAFQKEEQSRKSMRYILDLAKAVQADLFGPAKEKPAEVVPAVQASGTYYVGPRGGRWADPEHTIPWGGEHGGLTGQTTILDPKAKDVTRKEHEASVVDAIIQKQGKAFSVYVKAAQEAVAAGDRKAEAGAWAQAEKAARNVFAALVEAGEVDKAKTWAGYGQTAALRKRRAFEAAKEGPSYYTREEMYGRRKVAEKGEQFVVTEDALQKALFIGPRGGKWADAKHTIPYDAKKHGKPKKRVHVIDKTKGEGGLTKEAAPESTGSDFNPDDVQVGQIVRVQVVGSDPPGDLDNGFWPWIKNDAGQFVDARHTLRSAGNILSPEKFKGFIKRAGGVVEVETEEPAPESKPEALEPGSKEWEERYVRPRQNAEARVKETIAVGKEYGNERGEQFGVVLKEISGKLPYRIQWYNSRSGIWGHAEVEDMDAAVKMLVDDLGTEIRPAPGTFDKYGLLTPKRTPVPKLVIKREPVVETEEDEIRRRMGLDLQEIEAYDPKAAVRKLGKEWVVTLIGGTEHPNLTDTRKEAIAQATRHKEMRRDMYEDPTGYGDVATLRARESLERLKGHMAGGMTEMEAGERLRQEEAEAARPAETLIIPEKPAQVGGTMTRKDLQAAGYRNVAKSSDLHEYGYNISHWFHPKTKDQVIEYVPRTEPGAGWSPLGRPSYTANTYEQQVAIHQAIGAPVQPPAGEEPAPKLGQQDLFRGVAEILTPDELLQKGEARGGTYFKRTPAKKAGKWRYFYKPDDYNKRDDAHVGGEEAGKAYLSKKVLGCMGEKGCGPEGFKALVKKHGRRKVAQVLRDGQKGGTLAFKKGKFSLCKRKG